jgi:hypothetical protein
MGGRRPVLLAGQHAFILERIALEPRCRRSSPGAASGPATARCGPSCIARS